MRHSRGCVGSHPARAASAKMACELLYWGYYQVSGFDSMLLSEKSPVHSPFRDIGDMVWTKSCTPQGVYSLARAPILWLAVAAPLFCFRLIPRWKYGLPFRLIPYCWNRLLLDFCPESAPSLGIWGGTAARLSASDAGRGADDSCAEASFKPAQCCAATGCIASIRTKALRAGRSALLAIARMITRA